MIVHTLTYMFNGAIFNKAIRFTKGLYVDLTVHMANCFIQYKPDY